MNGYFLVMIPALLLSACAPATTQSTLSADPVFATGQVWKVDWADSSSDTLTVPARDISITNGAAYHGITTLRNAEAEVQLRYNRSLASGTEFITFNTTARGRDRLHCIVRTPGRVAVNQVLHGVPDLPNLPSIGSEYIETGFTGNRPPCKVTRLQ